MEPEETSERLERLMNDEKTETALNEAIQTAPECQACEGRGRQACYEHSGYGRRLPDVPCDGRFCMDGRIEEPECEACTKLVPLPSGDATPHFCAIEHDSVWYLCPTCREDAGLHLSRCPGAAGGS
jgi:hypothetical protein